MVIRLSRELENTGYKVVKIWGKEGVRVGLDKRCCKNKVAR